ncbi:hypothetical protein ASAP_2833 [Asaia bogorensis]|uniref:Uncharacterized protein n=1 Tax=Asaia bogorensis TaxID=91915 RepID=A0A060QJL1_9PROT|nr:hypothetical protein ASAP_2833 [Asaia bogorensis]
MYQQARHKMFRRAPCAPENKFINGPSASRAPQEGGSGG